MIRKACGGGWKENGDTVVIDRDGKLFDGQHRLHAIIRSGASVPMVVLSGIDRESFDTKDIGKKRGMGDVLAIRGHKHVAALAAILRNVRILEIGGNTSVSSTHVQLEDVLSRYPEAVEWAAIFGSSKARRWANAGVIAVLVVGSQKHGFDRAHSFFQQLASGENLSAGDPALVLRERLIESANSGTRKIPFRMRLAFSVKAWNASVAGKKIGVLKFIEGEDFPVVK